MGRAYEFDLLNDKANTQLVHFRVSAIPVLIYFEVQGGSERDRESQPLVSVGCQVIDRAA